MKKFYRNSPFIALLIVMLSLHFSAQAQMIITPNIPANQMVDRLVGSGVTYFNPTLTCPSGASGRFDNAILTTLTMDTGIVLTSGSALNTNQGAAYFTSVGYGTIGGDANLQAAATGTIYDLCKLEFDFIPIGDTIKFNYRFGSEEYTNYTCSNFNDIFSFFISGPGYAAPTNVALIPGTNCPVSINTVNGSNANPCGPVFAPCAPPNNALYINNTFGTSVVYDGLTQKLLAQAAVTPCSTYHMKFAIADVYDGILDSGVFLEAGSFVSEAATVTNVTSTNNIPAANPFAIEGCNFSIVTISRPNPKPFPQTVNLTYAGTATNGVDFPALPVSVTIPANAVNAFFIVPPIEDFIAEGTETLKIYVYGTLCANYITDSVIIDILEYPNYTVSNDDTICLGQTATLTAIPNPANPNLTFNWSPAGMVIPAVGNVVNTTPAVTTTYTVTANYPGCPLRDSSMTIFVEPIPTLSLAVSPILCAGNNNGSITATGNVNYFPISFLLQPNMITQYGSPTSFNGLGAGVYTVTVSSAAGCTTSAIATLNDPTPMNWQTVSATNIPCGAGNIGQINATAAGGVAPINYVLMPGGAANNTGIFTNLGAGNYSITATDANGCSITTSISISQPQGPVITNVSPANPGCNNQNGSITVTANGVGLLTYTLNPGNISNNTGIFSPLVAGTYTIQIVDASQCTSSTIVNLVVPPSLTAIAQAPAMPCNGANTSITITVNGGAPAFQYSINGGANQASNIFANITAGNYTIVVTDANGCTASTQINITPVNAPVITNVAATNITCNAGNNGSIIVTANGGVSPLNYTLQPGNINNAGGNFPNLAAGTYTVVVSDANGCTSSSTVTLTQPAGLNWTQNNITPVNCNGGNNGAINIAAAGGNGGINYTLLPNNINNITGIFPNLTAGNYTMTAADANGCSLSTIIVVTQSPALNWNVLNITNVLCYNGTNGAINANAIGGNGQITYNLQPNNVTNITGNFTFLTANTYTLQATDASGCSISTIINIAQPTAVQLSNIAITPASCNPGNDGSVIITASGGTPAYNYNIGGGNQAANNFANLGNGNYTVTVTDANGCSGSSAFVLLPPNSPIITNIQVTPPLCNGGTNGSLTVLASGGQAPFIFNLQPGNANNANGIFTNLAAGAYTVTLTDANGCSSSSATLISAPQPMNWTLANITNVSCNGGNDGAIAVNVSGGNGVITYTLLPNNISNQTGLFGALTAGVYTVAAVDANGCSITTSLQISQPAALLWTILTAVPVSCNGGSDGTITAVVSGGTGTILYTLLPNNLSSLTGQFNNLTAGSYTVQAVDSFGCSVNTVLNITEPALLQISNIAITPATCVPGNDGMLVVSVTGGTSPYLYNIGGANQPGNTFYGLANGNYTITVTDANGCTTNSMINILPPNSPIFNSVLVTDLLCNGVDNGTIASTATGGIGALTYTLQPGNISNVNGFYPNLGAGIYTLTVVDANGCTNTTTATITQPPSLVWTNTNATNVSCNGGNNGQIDVLANGGVGLINYTLMPVNITNNSGQFVNLAAGNYTMTATDANGCTLTTAIQITQAPALSWATAASTDVNCNGAADGSINATINGGAAPVNYNLQPGNVNNANGQYNNLAAGVYTLTATDANGCTITTAFTINEPAVLQITNLNSTAPSCVPGNDGSLTITASGGTPAYTYSIGGAPQAANNFNGLASGNYTVTVTDANGCSASSSITIAPPNSPVITAIVTTPTTCNPANTGTITIAATGGNGIYNYSADGINFQLSNIINGLAAGIYTVTVQDALGCTATSIANIGLPPSPIITNIATTLATCVPGCDATATIAATGGNAVYTYSIDNINFQANNLFNNVCSGVYTATVSDGNGCTATSTFSINTSNAPQLTLNNTIDVLCFGDNNGALSVSATGAGPFNYLLLPNGINNANGLFNNLTANTYTISATDVNGCSNTLVVTVNQPAALTFTNIINNGALCSGANNGTIDVTTVGGTGNITYAINPFGNFVPPATFNNLLGNTSYTVTATDANGCSVTSSVFIAQPQALVFTNVTSNNVLCYGGNNGAITTQASGGTGILNYALQPNAQNNQTGIFNNLTANTYTVTVSDANNCTLTTTVSITEPPLLSINTFNANNITCSNMNDGSININCIGGNGTITYNLQPGNITNLSGNFNNLLAGIYTLTVTDANGCTISSTTSIINPSPLIIDSINTTSVLCSGGNTASITVSASGGTGVLNYLLMPGNINNNNGQFLNLSASVYTITITDANLCSLSTTVLITEPLPLAATLTNLQNVLCSGGMNGQIEIGANGGTGPYTFTLLPQNFNNLTGIFANLTAGTYTVNVTDANLCVAIVQPIVINEPTPLIFDQLVKQDIKCFGDSSGTITVSGSGGTGVITYALLPNIGLQNPSGNFSLLTAGNYTITATDANNCSISTTVTLTQNPAIVFDAITFVVPKCWGEANGIIQLNASGGVGQLSFGLTNQLTNTNGFFNQLIGGNYLATVTDALGCLIDSAITLQQPARLQFSKLQIDPVFCKGYSDGKVTVTASGGNGGYTYYLRPGLQTNHSGFFINLHEGVYSLSVRDSMGCEFDTIIAVSPPLSPLQVNISKKDLNCYGNGREGWAMANMIGGNPPFTYLWSTDPPQFDAKATNLVFGYYFLEVIDAKGCKLKDSVYIESGPCCEEVFIPNAFSPNGDGNNDLFRVTTSAGIELIQFDVYDRWGKRVWSTNDFRSGWDGTDKGSDCDMNTYYYVFRYRCLTDGENYMKKGDINLIR